MKKLLKYICCLGLVSLIWGCQKVDELPQENRNTMEALMGYVHYDPNNPGVKEEVNILKDASSVSGTIINFTFSSANTKFTPETLKRCHLQATVPATARVELTDNDGVKIADSIGGMISLYNTTVNIKVVAANGDEKLYKITFRYQ